MILVNQFRTSKRRVLVVVNKVEDGIYNAYECRTRGEGGNTYLPFEGPLAEVIDALRNHYPGEELIQEV